MSSTCDIEKRAKSERLVVAHVSEIGNPEETNLFVLFQSQGFSGSVPESHIFGKLQNTSEGKRYSIFPVLFLHGGYSSFSVNLLHLKILLMGSNVIKL